jgi:hypothetical protein
MGRPRKVVATDLTQSVGLSGLNGRPVVDVARATLDAGASLVQAWRDLEPIARKLTTKMSAYVEEDDFDGVEGVKLLSLCASVTQKMGQAATMMLRASEGQSRLALLMEGGVKRTEPKQMTEKQLTGVVIGVARRLQKETGVCPICSEQTVEGTAVPQIEAPQ